MIALTAKDVLPQDGTSGTLAGRVWLPEAAGPAVVAVRGDGVFDVSASGALTAQSPIKLAGQGRTDPEMILPVDLKTEPEHPQQEARDSGAATCH